MKDSQRVVVEGKPLPGRKKRRRLVMPLLFAVGLALLACLVIAILVIGTFELTGRAAQAFGPPAPGLSYLQQLRLSGLLLLSRAELTEPANSLGGQQPFQVDLGESPISVASRLQDGDHFGQPGFYHIFAVFRPGHDHPGRRVQP